MIIEIRKTSAGTECWDNVEKKVIVVPHGTTPDFEVVKEPESMLTTHMIDGEPVSKEVYVALDVSLDGNKLNKESIEGVKSSMGIVNEDGELIDLSEMTIKELKEYAKENKVTIPKEVTKREDIAQYIYDDSVTDEE